MQVLDVVQQHRLVNPGEAMTALRYFISYRLLLEGGVADGMQPLSQDLLHIAGLSVEIKTVIAVPYRTEAFTRAFVLT